MRSFIKNWWLLLEEYFVQRNNGKEISVHEDVIAPHDLLWTSLQNVHNQGHREMVGGTSIKKWRGELKTKRARDNSQAKNVISINSENLTCFIYFFPPHTTPKIGIHESSSPTQIALSCHPAWWEFRAFSPVYKRWEFSNEGICEKCEELRKTSGNMLKICTNEPSSAKHREKREVSHQ